MVVEKQNCNYFEYQDCYIKHLLVFTKEDINKITNYDSILEEDVFEEGVHIMHHDFRKLNGILYSLKLSGLDCQAKKVDGGWLIQRKVSDWISFIGENYWISTCGNFRIEKIKKGREYFKITEISSGVYTESPSLEVVLKEYNTIDFYIRIMFLSKDYEKYRNKLKELL